LDHANNTAGHKASKIQLQIIKYKCIGPFLSNWGTINQDQYDWNGKEGGVKKVEGYNG
jgi:hypothetical protein